MPTKIKKIECVEKNQGTHRHKATLVACVRQFLIVFLLYQITHVANAEGLQVLHWWKSISERKAVDVLAAKLAAESVVWRDGVIPSGSGVGASIVLRSRILAGDAPEVAQLNGVLLNEWDHLGLLLDVDAIATTENWDKLLFPTVLALVRPHGHFIAAPLGIHRINTLFFNRNLFTQYGLSPPQSWSEFEQIAGKLQRQGITPLAQSSEPWQVVSLFETLVLAEGGAAYYRELFVNKNPDAFSDERLARALEHLRYLKKWMSMPVQERTWTDVARQFADGNAAMMIMGDWAKAELNAWGLSSDTHFGCLAVPETANYHLYDIDTLAMLTSSKSFRPAQEKLAKIVMSDAVQLEYNQLKGSIPVVRNPDLTKMDSCTRTSWKLFSSGAQAQVPSLAHRMAADEVTRDAIIAEVHQYFLNNKLSTTEIQRRLARIARAVTRSQVKAK